MIEECQIYPEECLIYANHEITLLCTFAIYLLWIYFKNFYVKYKNQMTNQSYYDHPEVIFDVIFEKGVFYFSIKNITHLPAHSVRISFDKKIKGVREEVDFSKMKIFKELEYLAPHKEIKIFLDVAASYLESKQPSKFVVSIKWLDSDKKPFYRKIPHNLNAYKDLGYTSFSDEL